MASVAAPFVSPGFTRPSSWPIRNQRRHAAIAEFQSQVIELLSDVSSRLLHIETALSGLQGRLPPGLTKPCVPQTGKCESADAEKINSIEKRIASMETLLFRASFEDFKTLDEVIATARTLGRQGGPYYENSGSEKSRSARRSMLEIGTSSVKDSDSLQVEDDHSTSVDCSSDTGELVNIPCLESDSMNEFYGITTDDKATQICIDETGVPVLTSQTISDISHVTSLKVVNIGDELRVLKEVHAADEKLTLIVGERYRVVHLDDVSVKLEFLDGAMPNGTSLTVSVEREDLGCFEKEND